MHRPTDSSCLHMHLLLVIEKAENSVEDGPSYLMHLRARSIDKLTVSGGSATVANVFLPEVCDVVALACTFGFGIVVCRVFVSIRISKSYRNFEKFSRRILDDWLSVGLVARIVFLTIRSLVEFVLANMALRPPMRAFCCFVSWVLQVAIVPLGQHPKEPSLCCIACGTRLVGRWLSIVHCISLAIASWANPTISTLVKGEPHSFVDCVTISFCSCGCLTHCMACSNELSRILA